MLISNLFSRKVYSIMVISILGLEVLFIFCVGIFYFVSLLLNNENLDYAMLQNNREIQNSFNSFLSRRISLIKQDLFLIGKHSDIFLGNLKMKLNPSSAFYKSYNLSLESSCLINGSKISQSSIKDSYNNRIPDKKNPLISYINNYFNTEKGDSEKMIKYFQEDELFDKISYFEGMKIDDEDVQYDITDYLGYVCFMKSVFKSIFIKESVSQGKYSSLNNIYLFLNNFVFQYLPNETNINNLRELSIYSDRIICEYQYTWRCFFKFVGDNIGYSINSKYDEYSYVEYFHYFDRKYNLYSCLNLGFFDFISKIKEQYNFVCIEHNINYLLQREFNFKNLTTMKVINNITDLISVVDYNDKLLLIYSLEYDVQEFYDIYKDYFFDFKDLLKKYTFSDDNSEIELFHLIYFDLFKYKRKEITDSMIEGLIEEYETIKKNILEGINELSEMVQTSENITNIEKVIHCQQTFLYTRYNIHGEIDYEKGEIKKDNFIYLISPILDRNVYYNSKTYTKINFTLIDKNYTGNEANILGYNIILFQNTLSLWNNKLFLIMVFILLRWLMYFIALMLFISTLFNVLFIKYLDSIFKPISLLYEKLSAKIMSNKIASSTEQNERIYNEIKKYKSIKKEDSLNDIDMEITSATPEMEELIQLCKFLENITYMKKLMLSNEQMELDFELMNEMYSVLINKMDMIKYGHFVSSFYFKKKKYNECNNSIKIIEAILEEEKNRFKEENENIEIEVINVISNKCYINEFQSIGEVFENKTSLSQLNYYELIIIREKLYFYLGICNFFKIKELKRKLKDLKRNYELQSKKNYYNNIRGRSFFLRRLKSKVTNLIRNNQEQTSHLGGTSFRIPFNSPAKSFKVIENQILKRTETALKYFKLSLEINSKYCINRIKCIIILLYIAKCQLYNVRKKTEAIDTTKTAIIKLYSLNEKFIEINENYKLNPIIMLLINGVIMEQILHLIVKINKQTNNKLTTEILSDIMKISIFKTDNMQSKACRNIVNLIKKANSNINNNNNIKKKDMKTKNYMDKIGFYKKVSFRLSPHIISLQAKNPNISKNIYIIFSQNLIKALPSYIELSEILSKCIQNYMCKNDKIQCLRFDMRYNLDSMRSPSEFNKEIINRILLQNNEIVNYDKYGMQNCIFSIVNKIRKNKILNSSSNIDILSDKEIITDDNYIFQFILSKDYTFNSIDNNKRFKEELKSNNISLYTFIFDDDLKANVTKEDSKMYKIIHNLKKIPEGVLVFVDNFANIKMAFQNISRSYKPKNIFRVNPNSYNNIYIDYH